MFFLAMSYDPLLTFFIIVFFFFFCILIFFHNNETYFFPLYGKIAFTVIKYHYFLIKISMDYKCQMMYTCNTCYHM